MGGRYRDKHRVCAGKFIEKAGIVSLTVEEVRNDTASPKRSCFRVGAKCAADLGKPIAAGAGELLRGVAGAEDEEVHAEEDNRNAEWLKVYLTDRDPAIQGIDRALR